MKALRIIFALAALALVGSALALVQPQGYAGKSLLRAANSVSFRGSSEGSSAFSPTDIAGLQLWLDASQIVGLNDGDAVATWSDLSGTSNDATQGTAAARPIYKTAQLNGRPCVRFDGVNDLLNYPNSIFTYTGAGTVFALVRVNATVAAGYGAVLSAWSAVDTSLNLAVQRFPDNAVEFCTDVYAPGGMRYNATSSTGTWYLVTWTWSDWQTHKTNGNTAIRVDGVAGTLAAYGSNPSGLTTTIRAIGAVPDGGGNGYMNGDIAALLAYDVQLTAGQITQVEAYLNAEFGR